MSYKFTYGMDLGAGLDAAINIQHPRHPAGYILCLFCKTPSGDKPVKCVYCKIVKYCSDKCRKSHWKKHKDPCELYRGKASSTRFAITSATDNNLGQAGSQTPTEAVGSRCSWCLNNNNAVLRKCGKCMVARYCDKVCQKAHWSQHKKECGSLCDVKLPSPMTDRGPENDGQNGTVPMEGQLQRCWACKKVNSSMKKCSKCKSAQYCDTECQRTHWSEHKKSCGRSDHSVPAESRVDREKTPNTLPRDNGKVPEMLQCFSCKRKSPSMETCFSCQYARYCNDQCQRVHRPMHQTECGNYPRFVEAMSRTNAVMSLVHESQVTDLVLPRRRYGAIDVFLQEDTNAVLLEIVGQYHHYCRHGVYIQDVTGETVHIIFYHDEEEERALLPSAMRHLLQPKNFIRWFYPRWHRFVDGMVGFRIDSLNEVEFIPRKISPF